MVVDCGQTVASQLGSFGRNVLSPQLPSPMLRLSRRSIPTLSTRSHLPRQCLLRYKYTIVEVDETGIPLQPTWSVNEVLSSYPRPTINPSTLKRLYELSALIPPAEGTAEHAKLTREMEELVKLVEAVKLVDVRRVTEEGSVPDGRIQAFLEGVTLDAEEFDESGDANAAEVHALLTHASRTMDGLFVVEADKPRG